MSLAQFSEWLNRTQMTSFTSFGNQIIYSMALLALTVVDCILLLRESGAGGIAVGAGLPLAYAIIGGILGARGINAASAHSVRTTAKEYVEAKTKGQIEGAAVAAVMTSEHAAQAPQAIIHAEGDATIRTGDAP